MCLWHLHYCGLSLLKDIIPKVVLSAPKPEYTCCVEYSCYDLNFCCCFPQNRVVNINFQTKARLLPAKYPSISIYLFLFVGYLFTQTGTYSSVFKKVPLQSWASGTPVPQYCEWRGDGAIWHCRYTLGISGTWILINFLVIVISYQSLHYMLLLWRSVVLQPTSL